MADIHTPEQRSHNMAAIRSKNTRPELRVRSLLYSLGYRFRLHRKDLPGRPDIVLPKYRAIILVHGCFWHSHSCRSGSVIPKTHPKFWADKRRRTSERDVQTVNALCSLGWKVTVIWECQSKSEEELKRLLASALPPSSGKSRRIRPGKQPKPPQK